MAEQSEFARRVEAFEAQLKGVQELQQQIVTLTHQIQGMLLFGDHPELVTLDDELDILYRGQL